MSVWIPHKDEPGPVIGMRVPGRVQQLDSRGPELGGLRSTPGGEATMKVDQQFRGALGLDTELADHHRSGAGGRQHEMRVQGASLVEHSMRRQVQDGVVGSRGLELGLCRFAPDISNRPARTVDVPNQPYLGLRLWQRIEARLRNGTELRL